MKRLRLAAAAASLALAVAACGGKEERLQSHMEKARTLFAQSEYDKASVEVRNVLQIDPRSSEAYLLSAKIWEKQGDPQKAFLGFYRSSELAPQNLEARLKLGRYYLLGGDVAKADRIASEALAADAESAPARILKAAVRAAQGDRAGALEEVRAVVAEKPDDTEASELLASLLARDPDSAEARAALEEAARRNPRDIDVRLSLVALDVRGKRDGDAERRLREVITLAPRRTEYRIALATLLSRNSQPEKAEQVLREAIQANPDDERGYLLLADQISATRGDEAAAKELASRIKDRPKDFDLLFGLASLHASAGRPAEAQKVYGQIVALDKNGPRAVQAQGQMARLAFADGREADGDRLLSEILKASPRDNAALLLRAQRSLQRKDPGSAIVDLRAALKDQPDSIDLTALLARAHLANREPDLARDTLTRAVSMYPKRTQFRYLLAGYLFSQKDATSAIREIDVILRDRPGDLQALQAKAELQLASGNAAAAEATLRALIKAAPESPLGYFRLANLLASQKKYSAALEQLNLAASKAPENVEVLGAIAKLLIVQKRPDEALARLRQASRSHPDNTLIQVMLGEMLAAQRKYDEAAPLFRSAAEKEPRLEAAHVNLAHVLLARGDPRGAEQAAKNGLAALPSSIALGNLFAETLEERGDYNGAIAQYESMFAVYPGNDLVANNLASLISDHRDDGASIARATELARRLEKSQNPLYLDTVGWADYRAGKYQQAAEILARAAAGSDEPVIQYHLGMALRQVGQEEAARAHLKRAVEAKADFPGRSEAVALLGQG